MRSVIKASIFEPQEGVSRVTDCLARAHPLRLFCLACNEIARQGKHEVSSGLLVTCLCPPRLATTGGGGDSRVSPRIHPLFFDVTEVNQMASFIAR